MSGVIVDPEKLRGHGSRLLGEELLLFPIRHHSPACARHLAELIADRRPSHILVEGPPSYDALIPLLVHPEATYPLAIYSNVTLMADALGNDRRHSSYYPLADHSPELVAMREGAAIGATLSFADLEYSVRPRHKSESGERVSDADDASDGGSLLAERHLANSATLALAARRAGCRDHNELWDHLFESTERTLEDFVASVSAYGIIGRAHYRRSDLEGDLTLARESAMIEKTQAALAKREADSSAGPVLVVTGAFHTPRLAGVLIDGDIDDAPEIDAVPVAETGSYLIRYGYEQLDALNGYGAGMPSPNWYQRCFASELEPGTDASRHGLALQVLSDVVDDLREMDVVASLSTPSLAAALQQAATLAAIRGRTKVSRSDVIDAVTSCFVQGDIESDGAEIMRAVRRVMMGTAIGALPPGAGRPPLAEDFDRQAKLLGLPIESSVPSQLALDVYRTPKHRQRSRFLHRLAFLGVPYGLRLSGPRYGGGRHDLIRETWRCRLDPAVDARLVEASKWGPTVLDAAATKFVHDVGLWADEPSAKKAAAGLTRAAQLGIPQVVPQVMVALREQAGLDPELGSVAAALTDVSLLWSARQSLGGQALAELPAVARMLHQRACYLVTMMPALDETAARGVVDALLQLRDATVGGSWAKLDAELFWVALDALVENKSPTLAGATCGLRWSAGVITDDELSATVVGHLDGTPQPEFFGGLLHTGREALWQVPEVIQALNALVQDWDRSDFLSRLPQLRSAFAELSPARQTEWPKWWPLRLGPPWMPHGCRTSQNTSCLPTSRHLKPYERASSMTDCGGRRHD